VIPDRTYWTATKLLSGAGLDGRELVHDPEKGILIASLTTSGKHAPCLDFDFRCEVVTKYDGSSLVLHLNKPVRLDWYTQGLGALIDAGLVRSDIVNHADRVWLHLLVPCRVIPSSNPDHRHVYFDTELDWPVYERMLKALHPWPCQRAFCDNSVQRGMTMLIRPGLTKDKLEEMGVEILTASDGEWVENEIETPEEIEHMERDAAREVEF
jgi:hypothetical protein